MPNYSRDRDRVVSLFSLPCNAPDSMDYRRDARRGGWWAWWTVDRMSIAAAAALFTSCIIFIFQYSFPKPDVCSALVPVNRGAGHRGSPRAVVMNTNERRGLGKVRGYRDPVLTCVGLFVFLGILFVLTI